MHEKAPDPTHLKSDNTNLPLIAMVQCDVLNNRIVVSLWTIQVVTVLFTVTSLSIWILLGAGMPLDEIGALVLGICSLALLMAALLTEFRVYMLHTLSIGVYLRLQVAKVMCWAVVLLVLLQCSAGVEDTKTGVFVAAAKKLILPFIASVLHSITVYNQERVSKARNGVDLVDQLFLASQRHELTSPG